MVLGWIVSSWLSLGVLLAMGTSVFGKAEKGPEGFLWIPPVFSKQDSLFIVAATGEPRFKFQRDSCEKILVKDSSTVGYLLSKRLVGQTPRQRHYVEHLFAVIADSGKQPAPVNEIAKSLVQSVDSIRLQLLHIGSELGDKRFLPVARLYLNADSGEVRRAATRSLGMYPDSQDIPILLKSIAKTSGLERQENLWALGRHGAIKKWPSLIPLLRDENLYNRQLARRLLTEAIGKNWSRLQKFIPIKPDGPEQLEWALLASELPGNSSRLYLENALPRLNADQRKFFEAIATVSNSHARKGQRTK
jgi:hypothetical protein